MIYCNNRIQIRVSKFLNFSQGKMCVSLCIPDTTYLLVPKGANVTSVTSSILYSLLIATGQDRNWLERIRQNLMLSRPHVTRRVSSVGQTRTLNICTRNILYMRLDEYSVNSPFSHQNPKHTQKNIWYKHTNLYVRMCFSYHTNSSVL